MSLPTLSVNDTRNFVLLGHTGTGKTTLVDVLLHRLGVNERLGSVDTGTSMSDYVDAEKARKISIFSKPFTAVAEMTTGRALKLVFIDTPGYMDFVGQTICSLHAADAALIAVDASAGIQVGTRQSWKLCHRRQVPRAIVMTGVDKENSNPEKVFEDLQAIFGKQCEWVTVPLPDRTGVVDLLGSFSSETPSSLRSVLDALRMRLAERAAETDDTLTEKFLEGQELTREELLHGLRCAMHAGSFVPVFACSAPRNIGLTELLDGIGNLFPSPTDIPRKDATGRAIASGAGDPFVGFVWKTVNDEHVGQLVFVRVMGGTLRGDSEVLNANKNQKERVGVLVCQNGKKQTALDAATAGEIVALAKLKVTTLNDTLCTPGQPVTYEPMIFPSPVTFVAVRAKTQADEDKLGTAVARVCEEDPTLRVERNTETRQMILAGMGDTHIDVAVERMRDRSKVDVTVEIPKVPYRETVTGRGEGHYKHKKQSGGRGQYGEVYLRVEPRMPDDPEWFEDAIVGGAIPSNFMPAVQKGILEATAAGALAGYPVMNVKATVYDGTFHEVDSCEIAFKIAGARAFKDGMVKAKPVLLEPIITVRVSVPEQFLGDINGDLNHRRGRILGIEMEDGLQVVTAEVPQAEIFRYAAELRSMTAGQGTFEMKFCRYDIVPSTIAQRIIAEVQKQKQEED